jgi:glycosyltransferase involved in cell wall biosynthesis
VTENSQLPPILGQSGAQRKTRAPLHVLTLTPFYPSDGDDSAGCFVAEPLAALSKIGVANTVLALQPFYRGRLRAPEDAGFARWLRYFSFPSGLGLPTAGAFVFARIVSEVRALQQTQPIDLVHAHGPLPCGHAAMLLGSELGLPYVVSVHGLDAFSAKQVPGRTGEWCRRISQRVYRSSQRAICISEHVREQVLEGTGRTCRTSVVYNGVDAELFSPEPEPSAPEPRILAVGNLIPIKGHDVLIRAVAPLVLEFPDLSLEIIGEGPERSRLQALARELSIEERVHFRGRQSRHDVADAMRRCTIFALPSRYEGLGCVYLEAMSAAKPVIGCRGQGIAELVRHGTNGFLVGPDNEKELGLAIAMLLRDGTRRRNIGTEARDTILERLTLTQQAENLARIYRECAS